MGDYSDKNIGLKGEFMKLTSTQREKLVERLITQDMESLSYDDIWDLIAFGCPGYANFSDADLLEVALYNEVEIPEEDKEVV